MHLKMATTRGVQNSVKNSNKELKYHWFLRTLK